MLEPQDYRDALHVARARSLKGAAVTLGLDPATVGRRLEAAEGRLGTRMFVRGPRGLEPTPDGAEVVAAAERLEGVQLAFERERLGQSAAGALTLTSAEWGVPLLTPVLVELARSRPELRLRLRIENRALDLGLREADVALRVGRPAGKSLAGRRIGAVAYGLYASRAHLGAHPPPRSPAELAGHPLCVLDAGFARTPQQRWLARVAPGVRPLLETNSLLALLEAIRAGGGLGALPCAVAARHPDLVRVLPAVRPLERELWVVYHRDLRRSRAIRPLVDLLVEHLRPVFTPDA
ncbi:MAG: LysR family transcriptional regulator [Anaeromyxobacteraceae bacterium]